MQNIRQPISNYALVKSERCGSIIILYVDPILRLAILCMLSTKIDDFACHFGLKCSSFCKMNIGTNVRSPSGSLGYELHRSVALANKLLERTSIGVISIPSYSDVIPERFSADKCYITVRTFSFNPHLRG